MVCFVTKKKTKCFIYNTLMTKHILFSDFGVEHNGNTKLTCNGLLFFPISSKGYFICMHHPIDRIIHTTTFVIPIRCAALVGCLVPVLEMIVNNKKYYLSFVLCRILYIHVGYRQYHNICDKLL